MHARVRGEQPIELALALLARRRALRRERVLALEVGDELVELRLVRAVVVRADPFHHVVERAVALVRRGAAEHEAPDPGRAHEAQTRLSHGAIFCGPAIHDQTSNLYMPLPVCGISLAPLKSGSGRDQMVIGEAQA